MYEAQSGAINLRSLKLGKRECTRSVRRPPANDFARQSVSVLFTWSNCRDPLLETAMNPAIAHLLPSAPRVGAAGEPHGARQGLFLLELARTRAGSRPVVSDGTKPRPAFGGISHTAEDFVGTESNPRITGSDRKNSRPRSSASVASSPAALGRCGGDHLHLNRDGGRCPDQALQSPPLRAKSADP